MGQFQVTFAQDKHGTWPLHEQLLIFYFTAFLGLLKK